MILLKVDIMNKERNILIVFLSDTRRGECILGFYVRSGFWTDCVQILTTLGRKSEIFGNPNGGSPYVAIPPLHTDYTDFWSLTLIQIHFDTSTWLYHLWYFGLLWAMDRWLFDHNYTMSIT